MAGRLRRVAQQVLASAPAASAEQEKIAAMEREIVELRRQVAAAGGPRVAPDEAKTKPEAGPLAGVRIVEISIALAGPDCPRLLADQGADVIRVEPMGTNNTKMLTDPFSTWINRNKKSIAVDLKSPEGVGIVKELLKDADVLLQNFRPGVLARLGLGYEDVKQIKPDIVYVSSSGFGQTGPYRDRPAYDPVIQGTSGLTSIQADETGRPKLMRVIIPDLTTALTSAQAIAAALVQRERTGHGSHVEVSMLDTILGWSWPEAYHDFGFVHHGDDDFTEGSGHVPEARYERDLIYATATENEYITIGANTDAEWARLCEALEHPEWIEDERFATGRARATNKVLRLNTVESVVCTLTVEEVMRRLEAHDVPSAQINHPRHRVLADPQVRHNQTVVEYDHPYTPTGRVRQARPAAQFSDQPFQVRRVSPLLGQDTKEVLAEELGMSEAEIAALEERKVVQLTEGDETNTIDYDPKRLIASVSNRI